MSHPYVSEDHEGKPWFEWIVAAMVVIATVLAVLGHVKAATTVIAVSEFLVIVKICMAGAVRF